MAVKWSQAYAVYVPEIDAEHRELFRLAADLNQTILEGVDGEQLNRSVRELVAHTAGHFAHEERLMRAADYPGYAWHKRLHDSAKARIVRLERGVRNEDPGAARQLADFIVEWMKEHTRLADIMMGAHLRNHDRAHALAAS